MLKIHSLLNLIVYILALILISSLFNLMAEANSKNKLLIEEMIADFSSDFKVPEIIVSEAKLLLSDKKILFLDVREPKEIEISMIPHAISKAQFENNPELYKDKKIIAYCTIGYRSSKYADKWNKLGYQMINLRGSLLLWSHEDGALVDINGNLTKKVHVYGKKWTLLPKAYQAIY